MGRQMQSPPSSHTADTHPGGAKTVGEAMHPGVVTCDRSASAEEIAALMHANDIHCVVVVEPSIGGRHDPLVWGIVSDLDLVRPNADGGRPATAETLAQTPVVRARTDATLDEAAHAMAEAHTAHLVVIDPQGGGPLGILAASDIGGVMSAGAGGKQAATMYDNVIIGIDGRDGGRDAIALAHRLAGPEARYTLVHVTVPTPVANDNMGLELEISSAEGLSRAFAGEIAQCGERTSIVREHGTSVGAGLGAVAERAGADLVVVGACRRRGLERLLAGDDAQATVHRTLCAVAIATPGYRDAKRPIRRIGVACDDRAPSTVAMAHAGLLARRLDAAVLPMGVVEPPIHPTVYGAVAVGPEDPEAEVEAAHRRLAELMSTTVTVAYGSPSVELARLSDGVDLLVCGSRRHGPAGRVLLGSTSAWLTRHSHCPVLVAPRNDDETVRAWRTFAHSQPSIDPVR